MMISISTHAKQRMLEREIVKEDVVSALTYPDKVEVDKTNGDRFLAKKVYKKSTRKFVLLVVYEKDEEQINVITVISTSKIEKYF